MFAVLGVLSLLHAGGVASGAMIGTGLGPRSVAIADLNEDGYADLISGNTVDTTVAVSLGRGNGTFDPKVQYGCGAPVAAIAVGDLDQDGHLDVISCSPNTHVVGVRFGAGDGTLGARTDLVTFGATDLIVADIDGNTFLDILTVNGSGFTLGVLRAVGAGSFDPVVYFNGLGATRLAVGDVNNDSHPDVVATELGAAGFQVWTGSGTGTFTGPAHHALNNPASDVTLADFDSDGNLDVAVTVPANAAVNWRLGNGDGTFGGNTSITAGSGAASLTSADFNGDGAPDLAVSAAGLSLASILIGTGSGTFQPRVQYFGGSNCDGIAVGQLDGDAHLDLALAAVSQNSICTVPGNGDGTFQNTFGTVYVWNTTTGAMSDPNAWYPVRSTPHPTDVLVINRGGSFGMVGVGGSVAQVTISGGTTVSLSASGFGSATLNVLGGAGTDLAVERSSTLNISSFVSPVLLNLAAGATAEINGDVVLGSASCRLQAASSSGIVFQSTGRAFIESGATTPFGDGTGPSGLNSVRFLYGSQCIANAPFSVFGAPAPDAVVVFGPGSRYRQNVAFSPDVSGRTYGDFEYNAAGATSVLSGSGAFQVDTLIVTAGALISTLTGPVTVRGNIVVNCYQSPGALMFLPASPTTVRLAGTARQLMRPHLAACGSVELFYLAPNVTLEVDNPSGVEFFRGFRTSASVVFTSGSIHSHRLFTHGLHRHRFVVDSTGTVSGAGASTGWFACPLMRRVTADGTIRMDVGDSISYQPVDMDLHGVTAPGYLHVATAPEDHGQVASAQLDMAHLAHRSWSLWVADTWLGAPGTFLSSADARLSFAPADLSPGADPLQFVGRMWPNDGSNLWSPALSSGNQTATSIDLIGIPGAGLAEYPSFQVGQPITPSLSVFNAAEAEGNRPVPGRVQPTQAQAAGSLAFRVRLSQPAILPISVDYQTTDGTATVADGDYTPVSGTLIFAPGDTVQDIVVPFGVDATPELNETFGVTISNASNATIATPAATGTILDDDDLTAPSVTVVYPNGGELILQNQQVNLQWNASDNVGVTSVDLYLVRGTTEVTLAIGHPNTGSYLWTASGTASNKFRFRVAAHDVNHTTIDNSDAAWELSASAIGVNDDAPLSFALAPPAPSPSPAGRNRIAFTTPHAAKVRLTVHDIQGRALATLADEVVPAGRHERTWDATRAAAGVYFIRLEAPGCRADRRLVVVR